jgi:beta-galactosidase
MESRMYSRPWEIEEYLENNPKKPLIECEYLHSMGNSSGAIKDYTDLLEKYPMYQGGFVWDYIDQALIQNMPDGTKRLGYGGDFDEVPDDGNFCGDGIVFADRRASAKACEVKAVYQQVVLKPDRNGVSVRNKRLFESTQDLVLNVELLRDGVAVKTWSMETSVKPQQEQYFVIDMEKYLDVEGEYFVQAAMNLKNCTKWAEKGFEIAVGRSTPYVIENDVPAGENKKTFSENQIQVVIGNQNVGIHGKKADVSGNGVSGGAEFDYDFSRKHGGLVSIRHFGREILLGKPMLRFYRAATDNDKGCKYMFDSGIWQFAERWQRCIQVRMEHTDKEVKVFYTYEIPLTDGGQVLVNDKRDKLSKGGDKGNHLSGIHLETNFTVTPDGRILVEIVYPGAKNVPEFPLFGMEFPLKKEFEQFTYYGVGPEENYNDRNNGGKIGIFEDTVTDNYSPYLKPQACGNRTETRWLTLTDGQHNITFRAGKGEAPFQFTALHYNEIELDTAPHKEELPNPYCTYVKIMPMQMGIGGHDTWGAQVREDLRIDPEKELRYCFEVSLNS